MCPGELSLQYISIYTVQVSQKLYCLNYCIIVSISLHRYSREWALEYRDNLRKFFMQLKNTLPEDSMVVWNMTMPLGKKIVGGFLVPEVG